MKQFKALIVKDLRLYKHAFLVPIYILAIQWLVNLIAWGIAAVKGASGGVAQITASLPKDVTLDMLDYPVSYFTGAFIGLFTGIIAGIVIVNLCQSGLNSEANKSSELFYRTQPISEWKFSAARFSLIIVATTVVSLVTGYINMYTSNWIIAPYLDLKLGLENTVFIQTFFEIISLSVLVGSFFYFWSSIFKSRAFFKAMLLILGVSFFAILLNTIWGWNIPVLIKWLLKPIKLDMDFNLIAESNSVAVQGIADFNPELIDDLVKIGWKSLFSLRKLGYLAATLGFFSLGTFLYKRREIK